MVEGHKRKSHEYRNDLAGEYKWGDKGQFILLIIFIIGMMLDVFLLDISDFLQKPFPWYFNFIMFFPLLFIAIYFMQKAHKIIFEEEREQLMLIDKDVFARVRHPMYFGSIMIYLAFVFLSLSLVAIIIFIIVVIFYYYNCRYEEKILIEKLGDQYRNYMKKVPMLIPKIRK